MNQHCQELKQNILKIKIKTTLVRSILYKTNYTYPKEYIPIFFCTCKNCLQQHNKDLINKPTEIITEIITSHRSHAYSYTFTYITNM